MADEQEKRVLGRAIVKMTIEVDLSQPWSPEESVAQVFKRGADEATQLVQAKLISAGIRTVGKPLVTAVLMPESSS